MRRIVGTVVATGALTATLLLAGCASPQSASGAKGPPRLGPVALAAVTRTGSYAEDERLLRWAEDELIHRCMAARGLPYAAGGPDPDTISSTDDEWHPELNARARVGYGLNAAFSGAGGSVVSDPKQRKLEASAAYQLALSGHGDKRGVADVHGVHVGFPTDGCVAEARDRLYDSSRRSTLVSIGLQMINIRVDTRIRRDARYLAKIRAWSACMAGHGFQYTSPAAAKADLSNAYQRGTQLAELRRREVAVAVADGRCVADIALTDVAAGLAEKYAQQSLDGVDQRNLAELAAWRGTAVQRARTVVRNAAAAS